MGMAASQARFLNLTARKTNIEYHGQQINQQRTELSNESANLYNQMLSLQVPVPPNTQDYTKVEYTFMMPGGDTEADITQIVKETGGTGYAVVFAYTQVELGMPACADNQKSTVTKVTSPSLVYTVTTKDGRSFEATKYTGSATGTDAQKQEYKIHGDAEAKLRADLGLGNSDNVYYINVGTAENPKYQYYVDTQMDTAATNQSPLTYYTATDIEVPHEDRYSGCTISRDKQNRVQSFTTSDNTTFAVTTKTVTDEAAYNDAMNEYTYQSYLYEQEMNNINAKTSIVHAQDRELELKLKQLDTEHNAVQTEIDAVKAVCKKNVEDSFKTFA